MQRSTHATQPFEDRSQSALIRANCGNSLEIYMVGILSVQPSLQRYGYLRSLRFAVF